MNGSLPPPGDPSHEEVKDERETEWEELTNEYKKHFRELTLSIFEGGFLEQLNVEKVPARTVDAAHGPNNSPNRSSLSSQPFRGVHIDLDHFLRDHAENFQNDNVEAVVAFLVGEEVRSMKAFRAVVLISLFARLFSPWIRGIFRAFVATCLKPNHLRQFKRDLKEFRLSFETQVVRKGSDAAPDAGGGNGGGRAAGRAEAVMPGIVEDDSGVHPVSDAGSGNDGGGTTGRAEAVPNVSVEDYDLGQKSVVAEAGDVKSSHGSADRVETEAGMQENVDNDSALNAFGSGDDEGNRAPLGENDQKFDSTEPETNVDDEPTLENRNV